MQYLTKIYTLLIFGLFFPLHGQTKEPLCPPGTKETWGCQPGQTKLERICTVCSDSGNTQHQIVQIGLNADSHSGSHSGGDKTISTPSNAASSVSWPQQQVQAFFSRSWQEMLLSKETLIATTTISVSTYLYLCYQLKKATWLMKEEGAWCNWKAQDSFETFKSFDKKELAQELLEAIQNRYLNSSNPTDHVGPLNSFLEDYRRELQIFRMYFFIATWVKRLYLTKIFPVNNKDIERLKERIERLCYIKAIFFEWTTDYKTKRCTHIEK